MNIRNLILVSILFLSFGCKSEIKRDKEFSVEFKRIKADTVFTSAVFFNDHTLCLNASGIISVLDSNFSINNQLTAKFSNFHIEQLISSNDSVFILFNNSTYILDANYNIIKLDKNWFNKVPPLYNDEDYYIYSCSMGEWGSAIFFKDNKSQKVYSSSSSRTQQVLKFNDYYFVSNYLAHMTGYTDYYFIRFPDSLYQLTDTTLYETANWHSVLGSRKESKLYDSKKITPFIQYHDETIVRPLTSFIYQEELYSIYCTDSATILGKFSNFKLIPVDTLMNTTIIAFSFRTNVLNNVSVTAYEATWGYGTTMDETNDYQNTGLILIQDNKITFVNTVTPHMWNGNLFL